MEAGGGQSGTARAAKRQARGDKWGAELGTAKRGNALPPMRCIYIGAGTTGKWWARQDSNLRASGYEPGALPLSYGPRKRF